MPDKAIKDAIAGIAQDSSLVKLLKEKPAEFAKKFKLTPGQLIGLRSSDRLFIIRSQLAGTTTITFTTGSTITAGAFKLGPKTRLSDILK
jgi:hypothetical protein